MNTTTATAATIKGRTYTLGTTGETNGAGDEVLTLTGARGAFYHLWPVPGRNGTRFMLVAMTRHMPFQLVERDGDNWTVLM